MSGEEKKKKQLNASSQVKDLTKCKNLITWKSMPEKDHLRPIKSLIEIGPNLSFDL